jgi:hypothetical protein
MFVEFVKANKENLTAEFYIPLIVNNLIQANKMNLQVLKSADQWFGVTYQADKPIVVDGLDELTQNGVYPNPLW